MDEEISYTALLKKGLSNDERLQFDAQVAMHRKGPSIALILGIFFGTLGVDRFYIGHIGLGIGKLLTLGGFGIWWIIDLFLIMGATRRRNCAAAENIHTSIVQMR